MKRFLGFAVLTTAGIGSFGGGCGTKCDSGEIYDSATDTCDVPCDNSIDDIFPATDSTDAYYRGTIEVTFDDMEDDAEFTVTGPDGAVAGDSAWNGDTLVFTPSAPLTESTAYTISIDYSCADGVESAFTTSEVGEATNSSALVGKTFALDLGSGRFVEPQGIGSILGDFIEQDVLIGVKAADDTNIDMIGAIASEGSDPPAQETCDPTIEFPQAGFDENPFFEIGPETTTLSVAGYSVTIDGLLISGAFGPDGDYISGSVLSGTIDTRPLVPLLDGNADCSDDAPRCCDEDLDSSCDPADDVEGCCDEDQICDLAFQIGVSCIACESDSEDFCLSLFVDSLQAVEVSNLTLSEQHLPVDDSTAPDTSTNICDIQACSTEEECTPATQ